MHFFPTGLPRINMWHAMKFVVSQSYSFVLWSRFPDMCAICWSMFPTALCDDELPFLSVHLVSSVTYSPAQSLKYLYHTRMGTCVYTHTSFPYLIYISFLSMCILPIQVPSLTFFSSQELFRMALKIQISTQ